MIFVQLHLVTDPLTWILTPSKTIHTETFEKTHWHAQYMKAERETVHLFSSEE